LETLLLVAMVRRKARNWLLDGAILPVKALFARHTLQVLFRLKDGVMLCCIATLHSKGRRNIKKIR